jgi:hypothetical protein
MRISTSGGSSTTSGGCVEPGGSTFKPPLYGEFINLPIERRMGNVNGVRPHSIVDPAPGLSPVLSQTST